MQHVPSTWEVFRETFQHEAAFGRFPREYLATLDCADQLAPDYRDGWTLRNQPFIALYGWIFSLKTAGLIKITEFWEMETAFRYRYPPR